MICGSQRVGRRLSQRVLSRSHRQTDEQWVSAQADTIRKGQSRTETSVVAMIYERYKAVTLHDPSST
jgi:hypothetical protein